MAGGTLGVLAGRGPVTEGPTEVWRRLASRSLTLLVEDWPIRRNKRTEHQVFRFLVRLKDSLMA